MNRTEKRFENAVISKTFRKIVSTFELGHKEVLDLGCGFGEHLSLFGDGSIGVTTNMKEVNEGKDRGLSIIYGNIEELEKLHIKDSFDIIWANNFFEHILSPHAFLAKLRGVAGSDTKLILGVPVIPPLQSLLIFSKFRGALASNHINFFNRKTLLLTVLRAGWHINDVRPFISGFAPLDRFLGLFAPHLYIVARKNESFLYPEKKLQEWKGVDYYASFLKDTGQL
ncbi:MAG: methyltransferase domain-containing protein [Candidatus Paceibacterota bacterium]|jgi:SAM-dependent methyltransferase